ncbi:uncharacterized protein LOC106661947 isoform X2 [Cimex lectularius]|uniref:SANTA domain-containing protein n=1 Tax=Cimex lectularius TaxID=79782 RepID=A0A8I6TD93_CIMLE|nr:uncharacterized protein LOC106661947 isoform X2 [Cimex lectularius]
MNFPAADCCSVSMQGQSEMAHTTSRQPLLGHMDETLCEQAVNQMQMRVFDKLNALEKVLNLTEFAVLCSDIIENINDSRIISRNVDHNAPSVSSSYFPSQSTIQNASLIRNVENTQFQPVYSQNTFRHPSNIQIQNGKYNRHVNNNNEPQKLQGSIYHGSTANSVTFNRSNRGNKQIKAATNLSSVPEENDENCVKIGPPDNSILTPSEELMSHSFESSEPEESVEVIKVNKTSSSITQALAKTNLKVDFIISNWTLELINTTLRVKGDKYSVDGKLVEENFQTSAIKAARRVKPLTVIKTNKETFCLEGLLMDPQNTIPKPVKSMCKNTFPIFWKKAATLWISCNSQSKKVDSPLTVKVPNQKRKTKSKDQLQKEREDNRRCLLDQLMSNEDSSRNGMTPSSLLNSVKKKNIQKGQYTPPTKIIKEVIDVCKVTSEQKSAVKEPIEKDRKKHNIVVERMAKNLNAKKRIVKSVEKPVSTATAAVMEIPVRNEDKDDSSCFSNISSIESES